MTGVLILHPGSMGGAIAAELAQAGHEVHWVATGRSAATAARAEAAGAITHESPDLAVAAADVVLSICPPDHALEVASGVANAAIASGTHPTFVDANAIAPITMHAVAELLARAGCPVVDGGIVGPPPREPGTTRLFLSGPDESSVEVVAGTFADTNVGCIVLDDRIGAASALKMTYAAWTKGTAALLLTIAAAAEAHGVADALADEWERSQPGLAARLAATAPRTAPKAWRWKGEMEEIAATLAQFGLPAGFHLASSEVWRRLSEFRDEDTPDVETVLARLREG